MSHQDRREPLPKGYQFGDAAPFLDDEAMARLFKARYVTPALEMLRVRIANGHDDATDRIMEPYLESLSK